MPVKLRSCEQEVFEVTDDIAKCSGTIKTMLEDLEFKNGISEIPLTNVKSDTLRLVIKWAEFHILNPIAFDTKMEKLCEIREWDKEFVNVDQGVLFDLVLAANYLDIRALLQLTTKTTAELLRNRTTDELREILKIPNDFPQQQ